MLPRRAVLVLGLPASGKTSLAMSIAQALGATHISVGQLIRTAYASSTRVRAEIEAAYCGQACFEPGFLATLLQQAISASSTELLIIDGGPPMDEVVRRLRLVVDVVLSLSASPDVRAHRFQARAAAAQAPEARRPDDVEALFSQRSAHFARHLPGVLKALAQSCSVVDIDADCSREWMLRQALSALLYTRCTGAAPSLMRYAPSPPQQRRAPGLSELVPRLERLARQGQRPAVWRDAAPALIRGNEFLFVLKPGLRFEAVCLSAVEQRLHRAGYAATAVVTWPGTAIAAAGLARAHFELHYLAARWPEVICRDDVAHLNGSASLVGGFATIQISGGLRAQKFGRAIWLTHLPHSPNLVVNLHMRAILAQYEASENVVTAIHFAATTARTMPWSRLRNSVLGGSDPTHAPPESLRAQAYRGAWGWMGNLSIENNAFHLSAGPLEALRELSLWFPELLQGDDSCAGNISADLRQLGGLVVCDRPRRDSRGQRSLYADTEHLDRAQLDGTHLHDWNAKLVHAP
jgi:adenylate kinase family enzyme